MKVKDAMTTDVEVLSPDATIGEAAKKMAQVETGFLPIADSNREKLQGVITDRDLVVRGLAKGKRADDRAADCESSKVLYCFEDDDIETAAESMREKQVYRLVVLDTRERKQLRGIISLGDITRHRQAHLAQQAAEGITAPTKH